MESLEGLIERVLFHNKDNGYTVASFYMSKKQKNIIGNSVTIVGVFDRLPVSGEEYIVTGEYVKNPKFGYQFKFDSFKRKTIETKAGIINYLSSELFPGVGLKIANQIVDKLGIDALKTIREDKTALDGLDISQKIKSTIYDVVISEEQNQDTMIFLLNHNLTMDMANKIINAFAGEDVIGIIQNDPYVLIDKIERFSFKKADALATSLNISKNATCRLKALLIYGLKELLYANGNSYISKYDLYNALIRYIDEDIEKSRYDEILKMLEIEKKIYINEYEQIFDYNNYIAEIDLAKEITLFLQNKRSPNGLKKYDSNEIDKIFKQISEESDISFSEEQKEAIKLSFTEPIVVITGGPGTGKTTIIHAVIKMYLKLNGDSSTLASQIALLAPTGRAAKRLKESTLLESSTIHRFLGYTGDNSFEYNKYIKTSSKLIIVDESSMMDTVLASRLITSMNNSARLIIVGDIDQLPSVGPGQVLKDLIDTNVIKTIRLSKIHRQAEGSSIINLARCVNEGYLPTNLLDKLSDRNFITTTVEALPKMITDLYTKIINKGKSIKDVQILIPMYKGSCGINEINNLIQESINPLEETKEIKYFGVSYRVNDKVIQLLNRPDKGIMNGDIGYINNIIYKGDKPSGLEVAFDKHNVSYEIDELSEIALAYAISIHKSQGSEFDIVIMPFTNMYYPMLKRKLIYTGITRAKKILMMIGDASSLNMGIKRIEINRQTILKDKIIEFLNVVSIKEQLKAFDKTVDKDTAFDIGEEEINLDD